jgi:hypothetical protein
MPKEDKSTDLSAERAAFEAHFPLAAHCWDGTGYTDHRICYARAGWNAGREFGASGAAPAVQAGWRLVPVEPTQEMIDAADAADQEYTLRNFGSGIHLSQSGYDHWLVMLAAAPQPPAQPAESPGPTAPWGDVQRWVAENGGPIDSPEPVAWRDHVEQRIRSWRQTTMNRSGDMLAIDDFMGQDDIDALVDFVCDEWAGPAPAAPAPVDAGELPPLPDIVQRADTHYQGEGLAVAVLAYGQACRDAGAGSEDKPKPEPKPGAVWFGGALVCCPEQDREPCPHDPAQRCARCPGGSARSKA